MKKIEFLKGFFKVTQEKDFQSLYAKGFGEKNGTELFLTVYETLYLLEKNKVEILNHKDKVIEKKQLLKLKEFKVEEYIVYKDLRSRGYFVKTGAKYGTQFRVYDKSSGNTHALWLIKVFKEEQKLEIRELLALSRIAHSTKKKLLISIVDKELSVTYLENFWKRV